MAAAQKPGDLRGAAFRAGFRARIEGPVAAIFIRRT